MEEQKNQELKSLFVTYKLALKLNEKGFDNIDCFGYYQGEVLMLRTCNNTQTLNDTPDTKSFYNGGYAGMIPYRRLAPLYQQVTNWLEKKGFYVDITPEFYKTGINWNFQIFEYSPKDYDCVSNNSTGKFGDNGEYPTRIDALTKAIEESLKLI